jgi:hypothetical protein
MTIKLRHFFSLVAFSIFFILGIASSGTKHMTFTKEAGQIPPEFDKFKDTLLVISHSEDFGYNKYLRKNFSENYFGNYKIITPNEIKNYPPETYRYIFDHSLNYSTKTTTTTINSAGGRLNGGTTSTNSNSTNYVSSDVFFIKDRKIEKDYVTKSSAYYSKLMRAYIKALDEERRK